MLKFAILGSALLINIIHANEFFLDDHQIPNEFFKTLKPCKTREERMAKLNDYIADYMENRTKNIEDMPFIYRKFVGNQPPKFHHDEVEREKTIKWNPQHLAEVDKLPFLKRVWAKAKHPVTCGFCNGLEEYKDRIDEKIMAKIQNITLAEEELRHGKNHEKCHSRGNCDSHGSNDETMEAAVVYEDTSSSEEKRREEEILKEKQRKEAIEKLNYHFYRRAILESKLTGEPAEKIFKQYHRMSPQELQQRFHAVYQKYMEVRQKMHDYYQKNKGREEEIKKEYIKSLEKKDGLEKHLDEYQKFLREVEERRKREEAMAAMHIQKKQEEEAKKRERMQMEEEKHKEIYQKYLSEHRKIKEQREKEEQYKQQEMQNLEKQLAEIQVLKENIKKEIERTKNDGDAKDLASLEKLENELIQWEQKVHADKAVKLDNVNLVANKINELRDKLLTELKSDVIHKQHRDEESFENAKKRYLHVKENFNKQLNKVRDNLVKPHQEDSDEYESGDYKDEDDEEEDDDYNTHERQIMEIDDVKQQLTDELEKAKKEGKHVKEIYQLEGARKQIEDWEERVKTDNNVHYERANLVNKKIGEFKGFLNSYKVYKYSTTPEPEH